MDRRSHRAVQREFGRISEPYSRLAARKTEREAREIAAWIKPRRGDRVLDAACGPARLARALAAHAAEVHGLDLCPRMIETARGLPSHSPAPVRLAIGDVECLPYRSRAFHVVTCSYAFANLPDPLTVLREFTRVVRRHGRIAIVDVLAPEDSARRAGLNHLEARRGRLHTRILSASEFRALFGRAGLRLESVRFRRSASKFEDWLKLSPAAALPGPARRLRQMMMKWIEGDQASLRAGRTSSDIVLYHTTGWFLLRP